MIPVLSRPYVKKTDAFAQAILAQLDSSWATCSQSQQAGTNYREFKCHDGLLLFKKLLYAPNSSCRLRVVQNCHLGITKTLNLVQRSFWWPHMR